MKKPAQVVFDLDIQPVVNANEIYGSVMKMYEELIEKWTYHLVNCHGNELTMEELHEEQKILEDFLYHAALSPGFRQEICCPMYECRWVQHFRVKYRVNLEQYPGEEE